MSEHPILITGAARSGTSMVAGIIKICGGWGGKMTGATNWNRKGQFENSFIREHIVKPYFRSIGFDPLCQKPLPAIKNVVPYPELRTKVMDTFKSQGYNNGVPLFYKGPKMSIVWPIWHAAFPNARWLIVRRDPDQIANSCMRTSFMRAYRDTAGWLEWVQTHIERFEEMKNNIKDVTEVWSEDLIRGEITIIKKFIEDTPGLNWNDEAVRDFIEPKLWRNGQGVEER